MPTELETQIAALAVSMVPNIDKIRFVNSGTEACMSAIRLARGYTKRDKIIKFAGCYHGHSDSFLIQAGSGAITFGSPNSPGVTEGTAKDTLLARYNDLDNVETLIAANKNGLVLASEYSRWLYWKQDGEKQCAPALTFQRGEPKKVDAIMQDAAGICQLIKH